MQQSTFLMTPSDLNNRLLLQTKYLYKRLTKVDPGAPVQPAEPIPREKDRMNFHYSTQVLIYRATFLVGGANVTDG